MNNKPDGFYIDPYPWKPEDLGPNPHQQKIRSLINTIEEILYRETSCIAEEDVPGIMELIKQATLNDQ